LGGDPAAAGRWSRTLKPPISAGDRHFAADQSIVATLKLSNFVSIGREEQSQLTELVQ
jgi:hypothetical protein